MELSIHSISLWNMLTAVNSKADGIGILVVKGDQWTIRLDSFLEL